VSKLSQYVAGRLC